MRKLFVHNFGPLLGLVIFLLALWVIRLQLEHYHYHDIIESLRNIPHIQLLVALALTFLNYVVLTGYDSLALRYIGNPLPYNKIAFASFIGYAFSNNVGFAMLAGSSVRYRLYSAWGLTTFEITKLVTFYTLTLWLGLLNVAGTVFLLKPITIPHLLHLPFASTQVLGCLFLLLLCGYLGATVLRKKPFNIRGLELPIPSTGLSILQILLSSTDWTLAGCVLYALLPPNEFLSFSAFIAIFLLAQISGLASQVPGGLGVFETIILLFLTPSMDASAVMASLLVYRGIYYLLPLVAAAVLFGIHEASLRIGALRQLAPIFGRWVPEVAPRFFALTIFASGVVLLFSVATPAVKWRIEWLQDFLPLPVMEISNFLASVVGACLLILARGLQRRLDAAYALTAVFLAAGIVLSLFKGLDYEEAFILAIMLCTLLPCRRYFYRKASLINEPFTAGWALAIALAIACSIWLGFFSYKHVEYSNELWWHFAWRADAPRFLRSSVGVVVVAFMFALARLLRHAPANPTSPWPAEKEKVISIIAASPYTSSNLALLGDKLFLFSQSGRGFIMYGIEGRSWVAMGDPVGPDEDKTELVWQFREHCDYNGSWAVFYQVRKENLPLYLDLGLTLFKLGEEGRVFLDTFSLEGSAHKGLRNVRNRLEKEGCVFQVIGREEVAPLLPSLKNISDAWLSEKNTREKRFSLGWFNPDYLLYFPMAVVWKEQHILAFANLWTATGKEELSLDLMRYLPEAPQNIMEYLFINLMLWGKSQGYRWFNLGMAPLSGFEGHSLAPLWNKFGGFIYRHGEHFYNFQGLRRYKEKFNPTWEPRYLASQRGLVLPRVLANIAALISGGKKGVITK